MIPFDFDYYRPATVQDAVNVYRELVEEGKAPVYYGGGTELISMARVYSLNFGAVVDLKAIPETRVLDLSENKLALGAALTLAQITEAKKFPLLAKTAGRIADHTMQDKITLGGNLNASIIYRETALPLLLTQAELVIAGPNGLRKAGMEEVFLKRLNLAKGEFLVQVIIDAEYLRLPYFHVKKTKNEKIDYPLITFAGLVQDGLLKMAFSGLKAYPFHDSKVDAVLNDTKLNFEVRTAQAAEYLARDILNDHNGSAAYRQYVLQEGLLNILGSPAANDL